MTLLLIARHGNTFEEGEPPRRVGSATDLPLTAKGESQARAIGYYIRDQKIPLHAVFAAPLQRTRRTAECALSVLSPVLSSAAFSIHPVQDAPFLTEIDYGPDENQPESAVLDRIGRAALERWETQALPPPGWQVDPRDKIRAWLEFGQKCTELAPDKAVLAVTSNGIARFALALTGDFETARAAHGLKLATGALGIMEYKDRQWHVKAWNLRPAPESPK